MYGAKASAIAKAALGTWAAGKSPTDKTTTAVTAAIMDLGTDNSKGLADLPEAKDGFPDVLRHQEFVNLVRALAVNPLVA